MTEAEWLTCTDPGPMLAFLRDRASDRKCHLFAVACCRRVPGLLDEKEKHRAVDVLERFADGLATVEKLEAACVGVQGPTLTRDEAHALLDDPVAAADIAVECALGSPPLEAHGTNVTPFTCAVVAAAYAAFARSSAFAAQNPEADSANAADAHATERAAQADLLRDIFGPLPFRPVKIHPDVLGWNDRLVVRLAQAIYDDRRWEVMPFLADVLLDAGCKGEGLLSHARQRGAVHVRGCWLLDLLLNKGEL